LCAVEGQSGDGSKVNGYRKQLLRAGHQPAGADRFPARRRLDNQPNASRWGIFRWLPTWTVSTALTPGGPDAPAS